MPVYEHILVEAPSLEAACREALDDSAQPWGDNSKLDWDSSQATTIAQAVELPEIEPELSPENAEGCDLSLLLYDSGLELLSIPAEFAREDAEALGRGEGIGFS